MTDIDKDDVTTIVIEKRPIYTSKDGVQGRVPQRVAITTKITVDLSTNVNYESDGTDAGVPLTNLFTQGATGDLGLDGTQDVYNVSGLVPVRGADTEAGHNSMYLGDIFSTGATAASKFLKFFNNNATNNVLEEVADTTDITGAAELNGTVAVCTMTLVGTLREGVTL